MSNVVEFRSKPAEAGKCSHCQDTIHVGDRVVCVKVSEERFTSKSEVQLLKATATHLFCKRRAIAHDFKAIVVPRSRVMTKQEDDEADAIIAESKRAAAAKAMCVDSASLTHDQIHQWRFEQDACELGF